MFILSISVKLYDIAHSYALSKDMMKMMFWEAYLGEFTKRISMKQVG